MYYFYDICTPFSFGKNKGSTLCDVIIEDASYFYWCINNIPDFIIGKKALEQIRNLFPMFIIPENFRSHVKGSYDFEKVKKEEDLMEYSDNWGLYEGLPTFEKYNGSYAQDVMGYSDDDIDIILDGEPDAYWNID